MYTNWYDAQEDKEYFPLLICTKYQRLPLQEP